MIAAAKKQYVLNSHTHKITKIRKGKKAGKFKTYVGNRKEVIRSTESDLIDYLYEYYQSINVKNLPFGSVLDSMLCEIVNEDNRSQHTADTYRNDIRKIFPQSFIDKPINSITESEIKSIIVQQTKDHAPKPERLRKAIQLINRVFAYGVSNQVCVYNPAQYINAKKYLSNCNTKRKQAEEKEFSESELIRIEKDMMKTPTNPRALMALLAKETGMRAAEICALKWEDIEEDYIHIHRQQLIDYSAKPQKIYEVQYTKDEREHPHDGRLYPISAEIQKVLDLANSLKGTSDYVFHDGDSWVHKNGYERFLRRRCKSLGITTTNNHAFRIAINNRFIQRGLSADERALLLGHSVEVNERFYSKCDRRRLESISAKLMKTESSQELNPGCIHSTFPRRLERPTPCLGGKCSIQLSYGNTYDHSSIG